MDNNICPFDKKECTARFCGIGREACIKRYAEENYPKAKDYFVNVALKDEMNSLRYDLFHITANEQVLEDQLRDAKKATDNWILLYSNGVKEFKQMRELNEKLSDKLIEVIEENIKLKKWYDDHLSATQSEVKNSDIEQKQP